MKNWKNIAAIICWVLCAVVVVHGMVLTVNLISHYSEAAGVASLVLQAAIIWLPPALVLAGAALLLRRASRRAGNK